MMSSLPCHPELLTFYTGHAIRDQYKSAVIKKEEETNEKEEFI